MKNSALMDTTTTKTTTTTTTTTTIKRPVFLRKRSSSIECLSFNKAPFIENNKVVATKTEKLSGSSGQIDKKGYASVLNFMAPISEFSSSVLNIFKFGWSRVY